MTRVNSKPPAPVKAPSTPSTKPAKQAAAAPEPKKASAGWAPKSDARVPKRGPVPTGDTAPTPLAPSPSKADANLAQIKTLLAGHTDRNEEKQILGIFKGSSKADLNELLGKMSDENLHELSSDINDRLFGPDNKTAFLKLLSQERLPDLSVASRAKVISALQIGQTDAKAEGAIRDIFLGTKGADLSALKTTIDHGEDYHDLQQLVFHDIDDPKIRGQLLEHFKAEGAPNGQIKMMSDIDDTFYVNLKDDRYPRKTVYPGVRQFYEEMDKGGQAKPDATGDLMFLSARPYDRLGGSEHLTQDMLQGNGVHEATVLSGDFLHVVGNDLIAAKKYDNWKQIGQIYPEYGSAFVGDSGQGDAIFGAKAAATPNTPMKAVFIHNVTHMGDAERKDFAAKGVQVFDTYVGAATDAYKQGLISRDGLQRVAESAVKELDQVQFSSPDQKAAREQDLRRDLEAMKAALQ